MNPLNVLAFAAVFFQYSLASRILAIIPFSGKSHYIYTQSIVLELANRGHHVTVITVYSEKNPPPTYKELLVDKKFFWDFLSEDDKFSLELISFEGMLNLVWGAQYFLTDGVFNSTTLQDFIKNDKSHYELIFVEVFYQESLYMFSHKYKAPIVGVSTMGFAQFIGEAQGNPLVIPYMSHEFLNFGKKLSLAERITNLYATTYDLFCRNFFLLPKHQKLAEKHFDHLPKPLPQLRDIERNISIVLVNTHFSYDLVRPYVPGVVEIAGVHIKPPKKLPEDIKKFLDGAKHGAIFFSFGSNVQSKDMPPEKINIFLNVFKKLKQRVILKWEDDNFEDKPTNLFVGKWLPQNDILAHPNMKLFITHGGLLSTQEAIYHGVPTIGFPFYGDQFLNMQRVEEAGYGIKMSFNTLTESSFSSNINDILTNPKYMKKAKELSERFKDRPNTAMDTAIYWIEYVIRHKGAPFIRSPILEMSWFEYHLIDIVAVGIGALISILTILFICFKTASKLLKSSNRTQLDSKKHR